MIEVSGLSRSYGDFFAVDNVGFNIPHGEIVGLLGHNGAGKTTIMKMLSGYLEPSSGRISIDGIDLLSNPHGVQTRLGYLPENPPLYPEMSVADYLDYAATLKNLDRNGRRQAITKVVRDLELRDKLLEPIATLSRGFKQRVGVAQAILCSPKVLILDEPTNGLDPNQTQHMRDLIKSLAENATVILSTHIMQEVGALCDRVLILRNGKLALDAKLASLRSSGYLQLKASISEAEAQTLLAGIGNISSISCNGEHSYRLQLTDSNNIDATASAIATTIIGFGAKLYQLSPEQRDLEAVFHQVNAGEFSNVA